MHGAWGFYVGPRLTKHDAKSMEKQDFLSAAIYNNRELLEEWLIGNETANITFLNEVLQKACQYGSFSVVELLSRLGKIMVGNSPS